MLRLRLAASSFGSGLYGGGWRGVGAVGACTESLGSESGDVGGDDDAEIDSQLRQQAASACGEHVVDEDDEDDEVAVLPAPEQKKLLPPPMPRAAEGATFMRAERRGGRLILTEVRAEPRRRDVFRAERAGGRLRLQFAGDDDDSAERDDVSSRSPDGGGRVVGACCNGGGAGELCQVAAGAGQSRVEIGALMGT